MVKEEMDTVQASSPCFDTITMMTGGLIPPEELAQRTKNVLDHLGNDDNRKKYIERIKKGKEGFGPEYFEKFPLWHVDFQTKILPMREEMLKDLGQITMAQSLILDLILITYFRIFTLEKSFAGVDLMLDDLALKKMDSVQKLVEDSLSELYKRLDLLMDMLDKAGGGKSKKIKIKAASFELSLDGHNLNGID